MWTAIAVAAGLVALGIIINLLMRLEERLALLNSVAFVWFSGNSSTHPVFTPLQLHSHLTRARASQALFDRLRKDFDALSDKAKSSDTGTQPYRDLVNAAYDREYESWWYSPMVEANLKVTLGQCSRDDALAWVLKQEPNMFELPRQERLDWAFRERAS